MDQPGDRENPGRRPTYDHPPSRIGHHPHGRYFAFACISAAAACAAFAFAGCVSPDLLQDEPTAAPNVAQRSSANIITADDIAQSPSNASIQEILRRYVPGFWVAGQSARPGGATQVSILGMDSPVFVLDGVILELPDMALAMNPSDVERIEVLKHGASTAMFGFRGSNGAILITTKQRVRTPPPRRER
jgi:TonB-dependent SusC/RagA subfamily outer membrane receptor